jgi:hypothetical protein
VGLFSKLFGKKGEEPPAPEAEEPALPKAVVVLRRGMKVPDASYIDKVISTAFPAGLPESVERIGLSQPSWYKTEEVADAIATGVVDTFAERFGLVHGTHVRRPFEGPDGCACLVIELHG